MVIMMTMTMVMEKNLLVDRTDKVRCCELAAALHFRETLVSNQRHRYHHHKNHRHHHNRRCF